LCYIEYIRNFISPLHILRVTRAGGNPNYMKNIFESLSFLISPHRKLGPFNMVNRCPASQDSYVYNTSVFLICIHRKKCKSLYELNDKEIYVTRTL